MRQLIFKLAILSFIVCSVQLWITRLERQSTLESIQAAIDAEPDVLYLGDSTIAYSAPEDVDRRGINAYLAEEMNEVHIRTVSGPAYHAEVYEYILEMLWNADDKPNVVVVPINLRSFSPIWDYDPAMQFDVVKRRMEVEDDMFLRAIEPVSGALGIDPLRRISRKEYMTQAVYKGSEKVGTVGEFRNGSTDDQLILNYGYKLTPSHRKVGALSRIAQRAEACGIHVIFYVTPVDIDSASESLAAALRTQIVSNIETLIPCLQSRTATLVDLSLELDSTHFSYERHVNEHMAESGRRKVATFLRDVTEATLRADQRRVAELPFVRTLR